MKRYSKNSDGVLASNDQNAFAYTDGKEAEERILRAVASCADKSVLSNELLAMNTDWVTRYHLSPLRANLVRPLHDIIAGKTVLELGAGCGALTRYFGETAKRVVAIEGSAKRSQICALRCNDIASVHVINDTIQNFYTAQKFDVVTLIGVLEYARLFSNDSVTPELDLLETAGKFLKDTGVLILAIENKLGMKYIAGAKEDHVGKPLFGVHNLYHAKSVATFGRVELESMLYDAGFQALHQYVPLPDYKLPITMLHPAALSVKKQKFDITPFVINSHTADYQKTTSPLLSLEATTPSIIANGLLRDLCNSFLYVAEKKHMEQNTEILVSHYGTQRRKEFSKETVFTQHGEKVSIHKRLLCASPNDTHEHLKMALTNEPYCNLPTYSHTLIPIVNSPGWSLNDLVKWANPWLTLLMSHAITSTTNKEPMVPSHMMDLIPSNCLVDASGDLIPFDLEWSCATSDHIDAKYVAFRGIFNTLAWLTSAAQPDQSISRSIIETTVSCCAQLGLTMDAKILLHHLARECQNRLCATGEQARIEAYIERTFIFRQN